MTTPDHPKLRNSPVCVLCHNAKDLGLVVCWICYRANDLRNGNEAVERQLDEAEEGRNLIAGRTNEEVR